MKTITGISALAIIAALSAPAFAQSGGASDLLNGTVDSVTDTVDDVTGTVSDTVDDVNSTVSDTVDSTTGDANVTGTASDLVNSTTGNANVTDTVGGVSGSTGGIGDVGSFADLLSFMNSGDVTNGISDLSNISDVQVVDIASLVNDFDASAFNDALSGNASNISALQNLLNGNQLVGDTLNGNGFDVSDVVAINQNNEGTLIVYTNGQN